MYNFICFNYTNTLDQFVSIIHSPIGSHKIKAGVRKNSLGSVLHIHGKIDQDLILGVNDAEQIDNDILKVNEDFLDQFVKQCINNRVGWQRTEDAKEMISNSHIICIFGMSLGPTDKIWWEELISWLEKSEDNKLIIFRSPRQYIENMDINRKSSGLKVRWNNEQTDNILQYSGINRKDERGKSLSERIIIADDDPLFDFSRIDLVAPANNVGDNAEQKMMIPGETL